MAAEYEEKFSRGSLDRMGQFIGQVRAYEGIPLIQLAQGLCSVNYLNQIENGEREADKLLTDAILQRLGKPAELFERILDGKEFRRWQKRQTILTRLRQGKADQVQELIVAYPTEESGVLDQQFARTAELNCCALLGETDQELLSRVEDTLRLTQPSFGRVSLDTLLLSRNEGHLVLAALELHQRLDGIEAIATDYYALLRCLQQSRYEHRESVYLLPFVASHVIEYEYKRKNYASALALCQEALETLTAEKRLYAYDRLLEWKQRLFDAVGNPDRTPERLLDQLRLILAHSQKQTELLVPYEERGHVYCLNQVIRDRRKLLGLSQEELAEGVCDVGTISRIENKNGALQKRTRKLLLQKVNMSGERYDYEIITSRYEDYLLRSEYGRACILGETDRAMMLFNRLHLRIPDVLTNRQYISAEYIYIREDMPQGQINRLSTQEAITEMEKTLQLTLPLDIRTIDSWPTASLSINELLILFATSVCYKKDGQHKRALSMLAYVRRCLENTGADVAFYEDLYTRVMNTVASILGDLGHYNESEQIETVCLKMSLNNQNSGRIALFLYNLVWNLEQQISEYAEVIQQQKKQKIFALLKQAYVAAVISGDVMGQRHICSHCSLYFGIEIMI